MTSAASCACAEKAEKASTSATSSTRRPATRLNKKIAMGCSVLASRLTRNTTRESGCWPSASTSNSTNFERRADLVGVAGLLRSQAWLGSGSADPVVLPTEQNALCDAAGRRWKQSRVAGAGEVRCSSRADNPMITAYFRLVPGEELNDTDYQTQRPALCLAIGSKSKTADQFRLSLGRGLPCHQANEHNGAIESTLIDPKLCLPKESVG